MATKKAAKKGTQAYKMFDPLKSGFRTIFVRSRQI